MMHTTFARRKSVLFAVLVGSCWIGTQHAMAQLDPQPLPVVKGVYRLPFADGTTVTVINNYTNHPASLHRIDLSGAPALSTVVSAGAGWIRVISENNDTFCPDACGSNNDCSVPADGIPDNNTAQTNACGGYTGPSTFCCERDIEALGGTCPSGGTCRPSPNTCATNAPNNFVWIEHANGEWTKYTHMLRGTVGSGTDNFGNPGAGRFVGEYVAAGTPLGIEGDVGFAGGPHCHFEVAVPYYIELEDDLLADNLVDQDPERQTPDENDFLCQGFLVGDGIQDDVLFEDPDGDGVNNPDDDVNRQNRIAVFCQYGFPSINDTPVAGPCDDLCGLTDKVVQGTFDPGDTPYYDQASQTIGNDNNTLVVNPYAGLSIRGGTSVTLTPGFHAENNSFFSASIGSCDSPGGTGE